MTGTWTDAEVAALRKRLDEGKSLGYIAKNHSSEVGGRSRSALAGKTDRLGLTVSSTVVLGRTGLLTPAQVLHIRSSKMSNRALAKQFGLTYGIIYDARTRRSYRHVRAYS